MGEGDAEALAEEEAAPEEAEGEPEEPPEPCDRESCDSGRISLAQAVSAARIPVAPTPRRVRRVKKVVIGSPSLEPIQSKSRHTPW